MAFDEIGRVVFVTQLQFSSDYNDTFTVCADPIQYERE